MAQKLRICFLVAGIIATISATADANENHVEQFLGFWEAEFSGQSRANYEHWMKKDPSIGRLMWTRYIYGFHRTGEKEYIHSSWQGDRLQYAIVYRFDEESLTWKSSGGFRDVSKGGRRPVYESLSIKSEVLINGSELRETTYFDKDTAAQAGQDQFTQTWTKTVDGTLHVDKWALGMGPQTYIDSTINGELPSELSLTSIQNILARTTRADSSASNASVRQPDKASSEQESHSNTIGMSPRLSEDLFYGRPQPTIPNGSVNGTWMLWSPRLGSSCGHFHCQTPAEDGGCRFGGKDLQYPPQDRVKREVYKRCFEENGWWDTNNKPRTPRKDEIYDINGCLERYTQVAHTEDFQVAWVGCGSTREAAEQNALRNCRNATGVECVVEKFNRGSKDRAPCISTPRTCAL